MFTFICNSPAAYDLHPTPWFVEHGFAVFRVFMLVSHWNVINCPLFIYIYISPLKTFLGNFGTKKGRAPCPAHAGLLLLRGAPRHRQRAAGGQPVRVFQGRQGGGAPQVLHPSPAVQDHEAVLRGMIRYVGDLLFFYRRRVFCLCVWLATIMTFPLICTMRTSFCGAAAVAPLPLRRKYPLPTQHFVFR